MTWPTQTAAPAWPTAPLPADPDAVPQETVLAHAGGWRFLAMRGAPLIQRTSGGAAEQTRLAFLRFFVPRLNVAVPLALYAFEMGSVWGRQLDGYPITFLSIGLKNYPTPGLPDLVTAMAVLMRVGLLVIDGFGQAAVTRTNGHVSFLGAAFIRGEEGDGTRLYWPGNDASGVTVGPGYDMGSRSQADVIADLTAIGVPADAAVNAGRGAQQLGSAAGAFVDEHRDAVMLSQAQQRQLLDRTIPRYEGLVQRTLPRSLLPRLFQHEFDAVVSLAWNTSKFGTYDCNSDMNRLDLVQAIPDWLTLTNAGSRGLVDRRMRETTMFKDAVYLPKPVVPPNSISIRPTRRNPHPFTAPPLSNVPAKGGEDV